MTFELRFASDWFYKGTVIINTLEDLKGLQDRYHNQLIVDFDDMTIWVYDDYME